jgi:hypothetical protein
MIPITIVSKNDGSHKKFTLFFFIDIHGLLSYFIFLVIFFRFFYIVKRMHFLTILPKDHLFHIDFIKRLNYHVPRHLCH